MEMVPRIKSCHLMSIGLVITEGRAISSQIQACANYLGLKPYNSFGSHTQRNQHLRQSSSIRNHG